MTLPPPFGPPAPTIRADAPEVDPWAFNTATRQAEAAHTRAADDAAFHARLAAARQAETDEAQRRADRLTAEMATIADFNAHQRAAMAHPTNHQHHPAGPSYTPQHRRPSLGRIVAVGLVANLIWLAAVLTIAGPWLDEHRPHQPAVPTGPAETVIEEPHP